MSQPTKENMKLKSSKILTVGKLKKILEKYSDRSTIHIVDEFNFYNIISHVEHCDFGPVLNLLKNSDDSLRFDVNYPDEFESE